MNPKTRFAPRTEPRFGPRRVPPAVTRLASGFAPCFAYGLVPRFVSRFTYHFAYRFAAHLALFALLAGLSLGSAVARTVYRQVAPSADGSGVVYMDRETATVMGFEGAAWLERPERLTEERPELLLAALDLKPGMQVADIGAGSGYYSWRIAERVAPSGRVLAVDVQPGMLAVLDRAMKKRGARNVAGVLGTAIDPHLPLAQVDLALMVDVYHEFDHPREMLDAITRSLKPGGRIVFVEYRAEDDAVPISPHHKMTEAQVRREATAAGLVWQRTVETLPWQHVVVFAKP